MSNSSGFSGFPPKISGADSYPPSRAELKAKIIAIRGEARVQKMRESMQGEVIRNNRNGTTDIKTAKGEITVELSPKDRPPEGALVILDVPKGEPPRQVTIIRAPRETGSADANKQQITPTAKQAEQSSADTGAARRGNAKISPETHLSISRQTAEERRPPQDAPTVPPLRNGDFLRLTPLPPYEPIIPLEQTVRAAVDIIAARVTIAAFQTIQVMRQEALNLTQPLQSRVPQTLPPILQTAFITPYGTAAQAAPLSIQIMSTPAPAISMDIQSVPSPPASFLSVPVSKLTSVLNNLAAGIRQSAGHSHMTAPLIPALQAVPPLTVLQKAIPVIQNIAQTISDSVTASPKTTVHMQDVKVNTIFTPQIQLIDGAPKTGQKQAISATLQQARMPHNAQILNAQNIEILLTSGSPAASKAVVLGQTPQSFPVLSVFIPQTQSWQNFTIPLQPQNLVAGTQLEVMPHIMRSQTASAQAMATTVLPPFIPFEFFAGASWPAAAEIMQTMQQAMPAAAQMLGQSTPNAAAPTRLPAAALLFVAAVRGGDISGWLGDRNIDLLKRLGKSDALNKLSRDMGGLQRTAREPVSQDWRGVALPMVYDGELSKLMLYYRHDKQETEDGETRRGTRFIFDLNLSNMGAVQIDGLHRPMNEKQGKLDLVVRTLKPVSPEMRLAMRAVYLEALQQADAIGDISFQNEKEKFITIDMPKSAFSI